MTRSPCIFRVRDGRVIGREHRFLENVEDETDEDVLGAFLVRWYLPTDGKAKRIVLPFPPSGLDALAELLAGHRIRVPQRGVAARWLELAEQNARHLLESLRLETFESEERAEDPVYALGRELGLTIVPRVFICVDISTNQGRDTVGSLVTFDGGRPRKSRIPQVPHQGEAQQDDYAAIHEVITRYFRRRLDEAKPLPDLVVIDGGKGQLECGARRDDRASASPHVPLISLAKREEEIYLPGRSEPLRLPRRSPALRLLQRARDEAHRFGVAYNRKRRTSARSRRRCSTFPGSAPTAARTLLQAFGSLAAVRPASVADVAALPGFSERSPRESSII